MHPKRLKGLLKSTLSLFRAPAVVHVLMWHSRKKTAVLKI
jgi:hypothetical protein